jgi:tetratricopeptide (TPR) repeat protein
MTHGDEHSSASAPPGRVFVGRTAELGELRAGLDQALSGRGRVFLLAGEPGIGKSELADRLGIEATTRGAEVLWGRSWEGEGAPPYWPWAQIIRAHIGEREGAALESLFGAATPLLAQLVPELRDQRPDLAAPPPLDAEQARFRLFDAITTVLKRAAETRLLLLILDDLQWADTPSLLLLRFIAREMGASRLLILATYRDVEVSRGHPLAEILPALRQERTVARMLVRGLPEADVRAMLEALRREQVPEALARAITRETEGNPFFVQELVRHLVDEGLLGRDAAPGMSPSRLTDLRLPESVRDVIGRRLGRLSAACTQCLTAAAVVGRESGLDALERIAELDAERLLEVLEEAVAARVVEEVPQAIGRYRFAHTLIRETLYEELRTLERLRRHHRVGEVLEALYARNPGPHLAELAHHFLEALPGGDVAKAVAYAAQAGDRANAQLAYEDAALHYERALQALELAEPRDERPRCELLLKLGEARWSTGGIDVVMESLREAAGIAERLGDPELFARAALDLSGPGGSILALMVEESPLLLERALAGLDDRDSALRAQVMGRLACVGTFSGDRRGTASLARAAIDMARRVGDRGALAYVLNATPFAAWGPDNLEERLALADELIRLAAELGDVRLAAEGHSWKAHHYLELGDIAALDRETELQERVAETSRQAYVRGLAAARRGTRAFLEGRFEEAEKHIAASEPFFPFHFFAATGGGVANILREQQGRAEELLPHATSFAARHPRTLWRVVAAGYQVTLKRAEEARRELEGLAANDVADVPCDMMWLYTMSRLSDVVSFVGDVPRAALLYDLLRPYADRCAVAGGTLVCRGAITRSLGILATVLSRYDEAERHFEQALEVNARIRARVWVAHTQHDYARMLVGRDGPGDRERAGALAGQALATAREVGMKPLAANVMELQAAAGLAEGESVSSAPEGHVSVLAPAVFRRDGEFWTISYEGKGVRVKDAKGLQYIARLLRHPGAELHVADLAAGGEAGSSPEPARGGDAGEIVAGLGDAGEALDAPARAAYRQRLQDLETELAEATEWADTGRAEKLRAEIEFLRAELSAAYGLGGRVRKAADTSDRARKAVTSRIRESIERIGTEHPALAQHLENAIRTGTFCRYQPDRPLRWEL